ncbi:MULTISPECIES: YcaO-like family protein [unclassified Micromonospora]|uniref:YcaO-like family protein n=1 Tax=unclassified Micromonospora TaxID=2617518 RepID=UPI003A878ADB
MPDNLAALVCAAETITGRRLHLIDMTTDLGVPAIFAYLPTRDGEPARIRSCGASLSRHYAIARAVSELVQIHLASSLGNIHSAFAAMTPVRHDWTTPYPALHACYRSDFSTRLGDAILVPYRDTEAPDTAAGHFDELVHALTRRGLHRCSVTTTSPETWPWSTSSSPAWSGSCSSPTDRWWCRGSAAWRSRTTECGQNPCTMSDS